MTTRPPPERETVLVVDDEELALDSLELALDPRWRVLRAPGGVAALDLLASEDVALIVADQRMPGMLGTELLGRVHEEHPDVVRILLTGYTDMDSVVAAVNDGHIYYYVTKPWDPDDLRARVERALDARRLGLENRRLLRQLQVAHDELKRDFRALKADVEGRYDLQRFIGKSPRIAEVVDLALKVAASEVTVLIQGETGTGKEWIARAIHHASARGDGRFVAVNCGAIAETLLESELFGYRKGSFTGATADRKGLFEEASGGTLLLDEVGETSPAMQIKLLRVLQERRIRPVGGTEDVEVDVRVISATHRDLAAEVRADRFREDLYYRLAVFPIALPPLRDRPGDVPLLAASILERIAGKVGKRIAGITPPALARLQSYPFPGNVRELENELERACVIADDGTALDVAQLSPHIRGTAPPPTAPAAATAGDGSAGADAAAGERAPGVAEGVIPGASVGVPDDVHDLREARRAFERDFILRALDACGGNVTRAAQRLGLSRMGLQKKLKEIRGARPSSGSGGADGPDGPDGPGGEREADAVEPVDAPA